MALVQWIGNAQFFTMLDTITVNAVANGATISAQVSNKILTYTCTNTDTTTTAAAALAALLSAAGIPAEFTEITFTSAINVLTAAATTPGTPFTLTVSAAGGATVTQVHTTANGSPSDVDNVNNWLRGGTYALPQNGDTVLVAGQSAPALLWNLNKLANVQFASYQRWASFAATIGLPDVNPLGYLEYRPKYFQFNNGSSSSSSAGPATPLSVVLGVGPAGSGPSRERYDVGNAQTAFTILSSGSPADDNAVTILGSAANTLLIQSASVGVAMGAAETASLASATVDGGGSLSLGQGCTFSGTLTVNNAGSAYLLTPPSAVVVQNGGSVIVAADGVTWPIVTAEGGSSLTWLAGGIIADFTLETNSFFDKSQDLRALTILAAAIDGDSCQVNDPNSVITWPHGFTLNGQITSGAILTGPGRDWNVA